MKRDFVSLTDFSAKELRDLLSLGRSLKEQSRRREFPKLLKERCYALIFHKHSLRTRVAFEVAIHQLGGLAIHLTEDDFSLGKRESIRDVAKVMSRLVDGILIRTFHHADVMELAKHAEVPVINMLTDFNHPCQILADIFTIEEHFGSFEGKKIAYFGDGNNVTHSWLNLAARLPLNLWIATSPETLPDARVLENARAQGVAQITVTHDPREAARNAHVLYTDVWASMGQKDLAEVKAERLQAFQLNAALTSLALPEAIVMHCLPAERGREITDEVLDSAQSVVMTQAENRLHLQKAILVQLQNWRSP